jgi:hypothetical protein
MAPIKAVFNAIIIYIRDNAFNGKEIIITLVLVLKGPQI